MRFEGLGLVGFVGFVCVLRLDRPDEDPAARLMEELQQEYSHCLLLFYYSLLNLIHDFMITQRIIPVYYHLLLFIYSFISIFSVEFI